MSEFTNYAASLKEAIDNDIQNKREVIFSGLLEKVNVNSIPEDIFVRYFLPRFTGQVTDDNWVIQWIGIAGSPSAEVAVVSPSREVLFRVPPILQTNILKANTEGVSLLDIFQRYDLLRRNNPIAANNFLYGLLGNKAREVNEIPDALKGIGVWYNILKRYNLIQSTEVNNPQTNQQPVDDFFDF